MSAEPGLVFGPVPSRRLGRSLGINNIPPKTCTYSCAYCQLGRATEVRGTRSAFYPPDRIAAETSLRLSQVRDAGGTTDYVSFVADGEPTLDVNLGREIDLLRPLGVPIAVISNGSLVGRDDVRAELARADWVSLKVDSMHEATWRRICRPHRSLSLREITAGMLSFAASFSGTLATETMLVDGLNTDEREMQGIASFLAELQPQVAYLSVATRPPAEPWVRAPGPEVVARARELLLTELAEVRCLTDYEGDEFATSPDPKSGLLAILAVHPMREEAVREYLTRSGADPSLVLGLVARGEVRWRTYGGARYLTRKLTQRPCRNRE